MATPTANTGRTPLVAVLMGAIKHRSDAPQRRGEANRGWLTGSLEPMAWQDMSGAQGSLNSNNMHACMVLTSSYINQLGMWCAGIT